jgi:hypothetical protein
VQERKEEKKTGESQPLLTLLPYTSLGTMHSVCLPYLPESPQSTAMWPLLALLHLNTSTDFVLNPIQNFSFLLSISFDLSAAFTSIVIYPAFGSLISQPFEKCLSLSSFHDLPLLAL